MESTLSTDRDGTLPAGKQWKRLENEQTTPLFLMLTPSSGGVVDVLGKSQCVPRGSVDENTDGFPVRVFLMPCLSILAVTSDPVSPCC